MGLKYVPQILGNSGLYISPVILGCMSYGTSKWRQWVPDEADALPVIKAAWDVGINTWDTANMYSNGYSEKVLAAAIREYKIPRASVVIMTKRFYPVCEDPTTINWVAGVREDQEYVNRAGLSRAAIFNQVNESLRRLETEYIDLLQIHRLDGTPMEEIMEALHDLIKSGKVRYIGASSMWTFEFVQLQAIAEKRGWTKFISMQNYHNLLYREENREMNRYCRNTNVGLIPWSPLAQGALARPIRNILDGTRTSVDRETLASINSAADKEIIKRVKEVAEKKGLTMAQVAFLWCAGEVTAPIAGISRVERVKEHVDALDHTLTSEERVYLEEPYVPKPVEGFTQDRQARA